MASRARKSLARMATLIFAALSLPSLVMARTASDYFVHNLPGAPADKPLLKMHAGHIEISPEHHGNVFFWHFENRHLADKPRTIIWLNGGPGCSSEDGALMEIGPYRVREGGNLELVDGSWDEFANVLFIDNPVGTGYSYVDGDSYVHELGDMANQLVLFLEKFFALFPHWAYDDIYIAGESYAGQHIPYLAKAILDRNAKQPNIKWNLSGLLIGNGWISGVDQYPAYLQYAYKYGLIQGGTPEAESVEKQQAICDRSLSNAGRGHVDDSSCENVLQEILAVTKINEGGKQMCYNMYDVRLRDTYPSCGMNWPPDLTNVTPYLRRKDVTEALHVNPEKHAGWMECNGDVGSAFRARNSPPSRELLPGLLEQVPVLLFSGQQDLICNHLGTEELINNLEWNGGKGFELSPGVTAPRRQWTFEGEAAGFYQEARNLSYVLIYNSSHMVPFDHPRRTRDMLDRFLRVDISSIGGKPTDSSIDGAKAPSTSVGGHPNSTIAQAEQAANLKAAEWKAYRRAGELALIVVSISAGLWFWFIWRQRRKTKGYSGVMGGDPDDSRQGIRLSTSNKKRGAHDVEAGDFHEHELDELASDSEDDLGAGRRKEGNGYAIGDGEDSDEGEGAYKGKGPANGGTRH